HVGVLAGAENGRIALQVNGVGKFNRSGRASITVGTSSKKITVPGGVTTAAFGIATLQTNRAGYYVQAVVPSASTSTITVYLNKAVTTSAISFGGIVFSGDGRAAAPGATRRTPPPPRTLPPAGASRTAGAAAGVAGARGRATSRASPPP